MRENAIEGAKRELFIGMQVPAKPMACTCDSILLTCNVRIYLSNAWNFQGRKPYDESSWNTCLDDRLPFALTHELRIVVAERLPENATTSDRKFFAISWLFNIWTTFSVQFILLQLLKKLILHDIIFLIIL